MPFDNKITHFLQLAFEKREPLRKISNAIRLVNGQGDSLTGLVLEQYNRHFVAQVFDPFWLKETGALKDFLTNRSSVEYLIIKDRSQSAASTPDAIRSKILIDQGSSRTIVHENGVKFEVDLNDTLNTGLFLDMRANRLLVAKGCKGKKVLNCFSYTCSFGVHARAQGAREVVNVDVSKKILERGLRNYELNSILPERNEFIKGDAVEYLDKASKKGNHFDVIILDPPSFARSDKGNFSVEKDLAALIGSAAKVLKADGRIFISTNYSLISNAELQLMFKKASQGRTAKKVVSLGQDADFPGSGQSKESHLAALWVEFS